MTNFFKDADGTLFEITSHKVKGDTIWEVSGITRIPPEEWVDALFDGISNSGQYYTSVMEWLTSQYKVKYGDYCLEPITDELKKQCVDWFNDLRDEDLDADDEGAWITDEPFTMDNVEL